LHLGCGLTGRPGAGWLNCDRTPGPNVDCVFDLMQPWPFADGSAQAIYASHTLEHLPDVFTFFREAWRVLAEHGKMTLRVPYGAHRSAWSDLTHLRPWFGESFACLQPGFNITSNNPQHDAWDAPFEVARVGYRFGRGYRWLRWVPWLRPWLLPRLLLVPDAVEELWVVLYALKVPAMEQVWMGGRPANAVPVQCLMYAHEWTHTPAPPDGLTLVDISRRRVVPAGI